MTKYGRQLGIGPTDNTSNERTPRNKLNLIPEAARTSFVPYAPRAHSINLAEADMTRIAPGRPRASGEAIKVSGKLMDEYGRILDMNNMDYSLSFELEILYDL